MSNPRGTNSVKIINYLDQHLYTEILFDRSLTFKLICIKKYTKSRKLDKNSVKETGIEFHVSPLSVIWMNIIYNIWKYQYWCTLENHLYWSLTYKIHKISSLNIDSSHIQQTIQHYGQVLKANDILRSIPSITVYQVSLFKSDFQKYLPVRSKNQNQNIYWSDKSKH